MMAHESAAQTGATFHPASVRNAALPGDLIDQLSQVLHIGLEACPLAGIDARFEVQDFVEFCF
jgi:hypothetical protein